MGLPITIASVVSFLLLLLAFGRTTNSAGTLFAARYPRLGQIVAGLMGGTNYVGFQFVMNSIAFNIDTMPAG